VDREQSEDLLRARGQIIYHNTWSNTGAEILLDLMSNVERNAVKD
jgi:hypothetical protein